MFLQLKSYELEFVYKKGKYLFLADTMPIADGPGKETWPEIKDNMAEKHAHWVLH